jgi:PAS domain S-box-containing protein
LLDAASGIAVERVDRISSALTELASGRHDVVLLDMAIAETSGFDGFSQLHLQAPQVPIVILSSVVDEDLALRAVRAGAQDYVIKGKTDPVALARVLRYAMERKRVEGSLRESEEFFRMIWENLTDLIAVVSPDGKRLYNSPSYRSVLGDPKELLGTDSFQDIHPEDRERIKALFHDTMRTGLGRGAEFRFLLKDGSVRYVESRGSVIKDESGKPTKLVVVARDVTQRKVAEEELREREEFFRLISENVTDLIAVIDADGRRLYNSPSYRALLGDPETIRGSNSFEEIHPDDRARVQRIFRETLNSGAGQRTEYRFLLKNNAVRYVESVGSVIRDAAGKPSKVVVVSRDMTERREAEEALRQSEQRYRRLLASTTDYIFTVTVRDGQAVSTTHGPGCLAVTGYASEEFTSDPQLWYRVVHEHDRAAVLDQVRRIMHGETSAPIEHRIRHKSGSMRWIKNTPVPRRDDRGNLVAYDGLISDITERKRAESLLAAQYGVTRALAESATLLEAMGRILQGLCHSLGWDAGGFWSLDTAQTALRCSEIHFAGTTHAEAFLAAARDTLLPPGTGLPGRVWVGGQPVWIEDLAAAVSNDPLAPTARAAELHSAIGFPIRHGAELLGVIALFTREAQAPDADLLQTLSAVGSQIGQFMQRKRSEEALAKERVLLRTLIDNLPDYIYAKDNNCRFILNNRAHVRVLGARTPQEVQGRCDVDFFPAELARRYQADDQEILRTGDRLFNREEPVTDPAGQESWVLTTKVPLHDAQGRVTGLVGMSRDITERKRAEQALRESQERLELVICGSNDGIWDWNVLTNEVYFSPRWKSMLGYGEGDIENTFHGWEQLIHPEDRERSLALVSDYFASRVPVYELEHRLRHKDGSYRWILARGEARRDAQGRPVRMAGSHVDLTALKQSEAQLRAANAELARRQEELNRTVMHLRQSHEELKATQLQLIQAEKMESMGTFVAGVAHEVKNPLQTIQMGLDFLATQPAAAQERIAPVLADMRDAIKRADTIIRHLLQYAAPNQLAVRSEDINDVLEHAMRLVRFQLAGSRITLVTELHRPLPPVGIEKNKIEQAFINLLVNAAHAMPEGGTLTLRTFTRRVPIARAAVATAATDPGTSETMVVVQIEDTGTGIPEAHLAKIFDPFFTTKPTGVGTGLGLPVTKKIIELHGGSIDVENCSPRGVRVTLMFKARAAASPAPGEGRDATNRG